MTDSITVTLPMWTWLTIGTLVMMSILIMEHFRWQLQEIKRFLWRYGETERLAIEGQCPAPPPLWICLEKNECPAIKR